MLNTYASPSGIAATNAVEPPGAGVRVGHRGVLIVLGVAAAAIAVLLLVSEEAQATHYRYGTLSWEPTGSGLEVRFTGAQAWRHSAFGGALGDIVGEGSLDFGDGSSAPMLVRIVSINAVNDWLFGEIVDGSGNPLVHTYATANDAGTPWVVSWSSCCRISPTGSGNFHINNPDQSERLETFIDLSPPANSSPRTNLPPINSCPLNAICTITIPVVEPDGDTMGFRLATAAEAGHPLYTPPGPPDATNAAAIHPATGVITWDTNGATFSGVHTLYSVQVMIEDGATKTPLDFFIELLPEGTQPPHFVQPLCGSSQTVLSGDTVSFLVEAASVDPVRQVTLGHLGLPAGATLPIPAPGNPVSSTFTWSTGLAQAGVYLVILTATDDLGFAAAPCPITIVVEEATVGRALAVALWAGTNAPASVEYQTNGVDVRVAGDVTKRAVVVDQPSLMLYADAIEEHGDTTRTALTAASAGWTTVAELRLLGGAVVLEGLENRASVTYDRTSGTSTWSESPFVARVTVLSVIHTVPAGTTTTIPLPNGGSLVLFERDVAQTADGIEYRSNLVHLYAPLDYGRHEVIVGGLVLQAQVGAEFAGQERHILAQDDARSGGDAGNSPGTALALTPGLYDASEPPGDALDYYALTLSHGDRLNLALTPAARTTATGGGAVAGPVPPPTVAPPTLGLPAAESYTVTLYDPTLTPREDAPFLLGAPQTIELNIDLTGTWYVKVQHFFPAFPKANNYSLAFVVTPYAFLPHNDALSGGDAPAACNPLDPTIPTLVPAAWTGVVRDADFVDVYRFHANIGELVALTLKPGETADGVDMGLRVWDRNCVLLAFSNLNAGGQKGSPELFSRLPSAYTGDYFAAVERLNGVGNYYLTLGVVNPMPALPTNDAGSGSDAPTDKSSASPAPPLAFQGSLPEGDAGDAYLIPLAAGQRALIVVDMSATSTVDAQLYRPSGPTVAASLVQLGGGLYVWNFIAPEAGDYGLEIKPVVGGGQYLVTHGQLPVAV